MKEPNIKREFTSIFLDLGHLFPTSWSLVIRSEPSNICSENPNHLELFTVVNIRGLIVYYNLIQITGCPFFLNQRPPHQKMDTFDKILSFCWLTSGRELKTRRHLFLCRGFLKWWYPTCIAFPTKHDHFGV